MSFPGEPLEQVFRGDLFICNKGERHIFLKHLLNSSDSSNIYVTGHSLPFFFQWKYYSEKFQNSSIFKINMFHSLYSNIFLLQSATQVTNLMSHDVVFFSSNRPHLEVAQITQGHKTKPVWQIFTEFEMEPTVLGALWGNSSLLDTVQRDRDRKTKKKGPCP